MHDADAGRHDLERVERLHAPFQKLVTLAVALEFHVQISLPAHRRVPAKSTCTEWSTTRSTGTSGSMIFGFLPKLRHRRAHRRQIHQQRHAGEILQHDARDDERDFLRARRVGLPVGQFADVGFGDFFAVAIAQDRFQDEADGNRQFGNRADAGFFQRGQRIKGALFAVAEVKFLESIEQIVRRAHSKTMMLAPSGVKRAWVSAAS